MFQIIEFDEFIKASFSIGSVKIRINTKWGKIVSLFIIFSKYSKVNLILSIVDTGLFYV